MKRLYSEDERANVDEESKGADGYGGVVEPGKVPHGRAAGIQVHTVVAAAKIHFLCLCLCFEEEEEEKKKKHTKKSLEKIERKTEERKGRKEEEKKGGLFSQGEFDD